MGAQDFVPAKAGIDAVPRHGVPGRAEDVVRGPVLAAGGKGLRQEKPRDVAAVLTGTEKAVDRLYPARVLDPQLRKMDERLPAIFVELGPAADPTQLAQFRRRVPHDECPAGGCDENSRPSRILIDSPGFSSRNSPSRSIKSSR